MKAVVAAFNQEKALVGSFSVIVQLHRLIDLRHYSSLFCSTETKPLEAVGPPFARVMVVVAGSPADSAGLKQGDSMTKFGSVTKVSRSI